MNSREQALAKIPAEHVSARLEQERLEDFRAMAGVITSRLAAPLYILFWLCDLLYAPDQKWLFLGYRTGILLWSLFANWLMRSAKTLREIEIRALLFAFVCAFAITLMSFHTGGPSSKYYAGLNLACLGTVLFLPWSDRFVTIAILSIYIPYYGGSLYMALGTPNGLVDLAINSFFLISTLFMSLVIRHFHKRLRLAEVAGRLALEQELHDRNAIIRTKTEEAVKLSTLSSQFSPQVVHAIRSGTISLDAEIHRANICAIFIDVVGSTERVVRIDNADVNKVISMFMDDTMKVLLKYDITIDKFLGDGVLGFSNDPIKHQDYLERTLRAALEVKHIIQSRQREYEEYWLRPFEVKIGVAKGYCNIGFWGSNQYFQTYTAIGPVVNLANRLCGAAEPNQIVVPRDIVRALEAGGFRFKPLGSKTLRGFESDVIQTYSLESEDTEQTDGMGVTECPQCKSIMHIDSSSGLYVFKCRRCNYVLDDQGAKKKAA